MSCDSAKALFDAYWMVAIDAYGDAARDMQPPSSRERLANPTHRTMCEQFVLSMEISPETAARAIGLEVCR